MSSVVNTTDAAQAELRNRAARVLEIGFRVSVAIMAVGLLLSVVKQEALPDRLGDPGEIARGITDADPGSILGLGILAVILTPLVTTGVVAWTFFQQGDLRYARISGVVLIILLASIGLSLI